MPSGGRSRASIGTSDAGGIGPKPDEAPSPLAAKTSAGAYGALALALAAFAALAGGPLDRLALAASLFLVGRAAWRGARLRLGVAAAHGARGLGNGAALAALLPALPGVAQLPAAGVGAFALALSLLAGAKRDPVAARSIAAGATGLAVAAAALALAAPLLALAPEPERAAPLPLVAGATLALGLVAHALRRARGAIGSAARFVAESDARNLLVVVSLAAYFRYRELLERNGGHLPVYEWGIGLGLLALALARLRKTYASETSPEPWASEARRHAARVNALPDPDAERWERAIGEFLDAGDATAYRALWSEAFRRAGLPEPVAEGALAAVDTAPRDNKPSRIPALRRRAQRARTANRAAREAVHAQLVRALEIALSGPAKPGKGRRAT